MRNLARKALPAFLVVLSLSLAAWSFLPGVSAAPSAKASPTPQATGATPASTPSIPGWLGQIPGVNKEIQKTSKTKLKAGAFSRSAARLDRQFIEDALASNTEELDLLKFAVDKVQNTNLQALIQFMTTQHSDDQALLLQLQKRVNRKNSANLTNNAVFPGTTDYLMGIRTQNLNAKYMDRLQAAFDASSGGAMATPAASSVGSASFDQIALDLLMQIHQEDIQTETAAMHMLVGSQHRALANHSAETTGLHLKLMRALYDKEFLGIASDVSFIAKQGIPSVQGTAQPTSQPAATGTSQSVIIQPTAQPTEMGTALPTTQPAVENTAQPTP